MARRSKITKWELREWIADVKARDNYTCQVCDNKNMINYVCAHHIKPKEEFPALAFDVDNGLVLCDSCHSSMHSNKPKRKEAYSNRTKGNQYGLGHRRIVPPEECAAISKRMMGNHLHIPTIEEREATSKRMKGKITYIRTPEQKEIQSKQMMGKQIALGHVVTTKQKETHRQQSLAYWAKVRSGEIIRITKRKQT